MSESRSDLEGLQRLATRQTAILKTLIDISRIITTSHDLKETLEHTVELVAESLAVDVCSIYIHNIESGMLELRATHGLAQGAVGRVEMPANEGLIGHVFEQKRHVNVRDVAQHPRFKYFPGIDEERLSSFLGVPLIEFRNVLGVLVVQNQENRRFTNEEENLLITIASQISGLISKALLVDRLQQEAAHPAPKERPSGSFQLEGRAIAPGLAMDKAVFLRRGRVEEPPYASGSTPEVQRAELGRAIEESEQEILGLIREVSSRVNEQEASIFHSHLLFLEDRTFIQKIHGHIDDGASAAWAASHVVKEYLEAFRAIGDPYLKERAADLEDVGLRMLAHLGVDGAHRHPLEHAEGILVAEMLLPSDTAQIDPRRIKGIVTTVGGHVSHAAILARSLRIPAVSGIENLFSLLADGEDVLVDGQAGIVFVKPAESLVREVERYQETRADYLVHLADLRDVPCRTACGTPISLRANVSLTHDLENCCEYGSEGIGLYRTEYIYLMRTTSPSVDELVEHYRRAMEASAGQPVVFRTLDLGGERPPPYLNFPHEDNPSLGTRSIRFQLQHQQLLEDQITAALEVAHLGDARLAFPMISQYNELQDVLYVYRKCRADFAAKHGHEAPPVMLGMVFEVPSAVLMCELFFEELDFVSIGSNDLTQYVLAVDRANPNVSHLFDPLEPAVLLMIERVAEAARRYGKPVTLTGELASDPEGCLVLVGLGLRELSMNAPLIPIMKDRFAQYTLEEMEQLARIALSSTSAANVRRNIQLFRPGESSAAAG
jgi:phosphotransferase system enzyme I (PtsP)